MHLTSEQAALVSRIAKQAARTFARRYPWMDAADLEQEAWAHLLRYLDGVDFTRPESPAYLHKLATTACKRLAWRLGAVANVPRREAARGEITRQRAASGDESAILMLADDATGAEALLEQAETVSKLSKLVAEHLAADDEGAAIRAVLTGEMKSKQAAEAHGVELSRLYWRTQQVKRAMQADKRFGEFV